MSIEPWIATALATFAGQIGGTLVAIKFLSKGIDDAKAIGERCHLRLDAHQVWHTEQASKHKAAG